MADDAAAALGDDGVERVAGLHVDEIGPGAEHLQRPQLAAMFVRHDVVRIIGPRAVIPESADRPAGHGARGDGAIVPSAPRCARLRTSSRSRVRIGRFLPDTGVNTRGVARCRAASGVTVTRWFSTCQ